MGALEHEKHDISDILKKAEELGAEGMRAEEAGFWSDIHTLAGNMKTLFENIETTAGIGNIGLIIIGTHATGDVVVQAGFGPTNALQNCVRAVPEAFKEIMAIPSRPLVDMLNGPVSDDPDFAKSVEEFEELKEWAKSHISEIPMRWRIRMIKAEGPDFLKATKECRAFLEEHPNALKEEQEEMANGTLTMKQIMDEEGVTIKDLFGKL